MLFGRFCWQKDWDHEQHVNLLESRVCREWEEALVYGQRTAALLDSSIAGSPFAPPRMAGARRKSYGACCGTALQWSWEGSLSPRHYSISLERG